ncbi:EF-hand domain-containing protein [Streptomyces hainanensis]|uniref:Calcium-binding protein n=1 Tax=Streptomyces hainanensis TaxID=402648 RepID=A0A4V2Y3S8_9ACTN|nr:EF-hand domain-containing protein [Streptomyces hainanensis]TDC77655.1 calcium-binding protein [Streptomyces hainanensis]
MRTEAISRVRLVFTLFDANGNGRLEADDFDLMSSRVEEAAQASDASARQAMRVAFRRYWSTLATELDTDGDGRVSYDEFVRCVLSPERFDATVAEFAEALAALGDPDGDGLVDRPTFVALMLAIGFDRPNIDALFDAFGPTDTDHIPAVTWREGIKDYYAPEKADIPGDRLVGGTAV